MIPLLTSLALAAAGTLQAGSFAFEAFSVGTFTADGGFPMVTVHIDHPAVTATPFPFAALVADQAVNLLDVPPSLSGTFTFTDTLGESLFGAYEGVLQPGANAAQLLAPGTFLFTGGTGSFESASGGGSIYAMIDFTGSNEGLSTLKWEGTLNSVPEPTHGGLFAGAMLGAIGLWRYTRPSRTTGTATILIQP